MTPSSSTHFPDPITANARPGATKAGTNRARFALPPAEELKTGDLLEVLEQHRAPIYPSLPMYAEIPRASSSWNQFNDQDITRVDPEPPSDSIPPPPAEAPTTAPGTPTLEVIAGRDLAQTFALSTVETTLGRGIENDIILSDLSVSRGHLRLIRRDGAVRVKDLGSGNGTLVNGIRMLETSLQNGDVIEVGETKLRIHIPAVLFAPMDAAQGHTPPEKRAASGLWDKVREVFLVTPWLESRPHRQKRVAQHQTAIDQPRPAGRARRGKRPGAAMLRAVTNRFNLSRTTLFTLGVLGALVVVGLGASLAALFQQRHELMGYRDILDRGVFEKGAIAYGAKRWDEAERAFHEVLALQPQHGRSLWYLSMIESARKHLTALEHARSAVSRGTPAAALDALRDVGPDSPYYPETEAVRLAAKALQGAELAKERRDNTARAHATAAEKPSETLRAQNAGKPERAPRIRTREPEPEPVIAKAPSSVVPTDAVLEAYRRGDFEQASASARELARVTTGTKGRELKILALQIERFASAYRTTNSNEGDVKALLQLDEQISGGHFRTELDARLQKTEVSVAKQAFNNADADLLLERAAALETSDPAQARILYRRILAAVPPSTPTHRAAAERLSALGDR